MKTQSFLFALVQFVAFLANGQVVNSGSDGRDGALNPTKDIVIDMADHPDGVYQYTSVNIPAGVTVAFVPNARNTPVVWLVQQDCVINGAVDVRGQSASSANSLVGGAGGPGGWPGGNGGNNPGSGQGPGGGGPDACASYATVGATITDYWNVIFAPGSTYGNPFLLPLLGGSGGGGMLAHFGGFSAVGGGGGGAFLLVASNQIVVNGTIGASGGAGIYWGNGESSGCGSGGAIRLVSKTLLGIGSLDASGGSLNTGTLMYPNTFGGSGRVRLDVLQNTFSGSIFGNLTKGFQPILFPVTGQGLQLVVASVGGVAVSGSPSGALAAPDVLLPAQQAASVPVVVNCYGVPLNSVISVTAKSANGTSVSASGFNSNGTLAGSSATINLNLPRGSGVLLAKATIATAGPTSRADQPSRTNDRAETQSTAPGDFDRGFSKLSYSITGLTSDGERIAAIEAEASAGGLTRTVYVTESGKRIQAPSNR